MSPLNGFSQTFDWAKASGGTELDIGQSIVIDDLGNTYTTGNFEDTVDFDPGVGILNIVSQGLGDIFILKLDPSGSLVWVKTIGGTGNDGGTSITLDDFGHILLAGTFYDTVDFDPNIGTEFKTSNGQKDGFIEQLDLDGNFIWVKTMGAANNDGPTEVITDGVGNVFATGAYLETVDFDTGAGTFNLTAVGATDVFILKLDVLGNFVWAKSIGGSDWNGSYAITLDNFGNIITVGHFRGSADFDPGVGTFIQVATGNWDAFIQKLDPNGNFIWAKRMGGVALNQLISTSVDIDSDNNIYSGGMYWPNGGGQADLDPNAGTAYLTCSGITCTYIQKLDEDGNFIWVKSNSGSMENGIGSILVDESDNVYATGFFSGTSDFDPNGGTYNITSNGSIDVFVQKIDSSGVFQWVRTFGDSLGDWGRSLSINSSGAIAITGYFRETPDFDPGIGVSNLSSVGNVDIFIEKLIPCSAETEVVETCNSYTWIDGVTYSSNNNSATTTLNGSFGCDSLVILNLTITPIDVSVTVIGSTLTANATGVTYQWLDCNDNYAPINAATGQTLVSWQGGSYALEVTQNGCSDTSACIDVLDLEENEIFNSVKVFPNPTSGDVYIQFDDSYESGQIDLININGRLIESKDFHHVDMVSLSLNGASGVYFLSIRLGDKKGTVLLMKE